MKLKAWLKSYDKDVPFTQKYINFHLSTQYIFQTPCLYIAVYLFITHLSMIKGWIGVQTWIYPITDVLSQHFVLNFTSYLSL